MITPFEVCRRVTALLTPDLLAPKFQHDPACPVRGHCYVASEALWWLLGAGASGLSVKYGRFDGANHWWLEGRRIILDPTAAQLGEHASRVYARGRSCGFLTKQPSTRTCILLRRYLDKYPEDTAATRVLRELLTDQPQTEGAT